MKDSKEFLEAHIENLEQQLTQKKNAIRLDILHNASKDKKFLLEMKQRLDNSELDYVNQMIEDWINELDYIILEF